MKVTLFSATEKVSATIPAPVKTLVRQIVTLALLLLGGVTAWATAPVLVLPASVTIGEDTTTNLNIGVTDTGQSIFTVFTSASSSNTNLVGSSGLVFSGAGTNRLLRIRPGLHQSGTATITVVATDSQPASTTNTFTLNVTFTNYPPVFLATVGDLNVNENTGATALPFVISDIETAASNLVVTATSANTTLVPSTNLVLSGTGTNRTLTLTPGTNQNGVTTIELVVTDGGGATATNDFTLDVLTVNQPPSFSMSTNRIRYNEYSGAVSIPNFVTGVSSGPPNQSSETNNFVLSYTGSFFTQAPTLAANGTLSFAAVSNMSGTNTITLTLYNSGPTTNGGVNSYAQTLTLEVPTILEPPLFYLATNFVAGYEESLTVTNANFVISRSNNGTNESTNHFTYTTTTVSTNSTNASFTVLSLATNGTLTFRPTTHSYGTNTVTVVMTVLGTDTNGWINSATNTFQIGIAQTNHAPTIVGGTNRTVLENGTNGLTGSINVWDYEHISNNFTLAATSLSNSVATVSVTGTNAASATNTVFTLGFVLGTNTSGVVPIRLVATEISSGLSTTNTFNLTVTLVNHAPSFTLASNYVAIAEETAAVVVSNYVASFSKGPANQSAETFTYTLSTVSTNATNAAFTTLTAATNGNLTLLPKPHSYGTNTVTMVMTVSGGTANGGVASATNTFQIQVAQTNHAPIIVGATNRTVLENGTNGLTALINVLDYDKTTNFAFTATSLSNSLATVTWVTNAAGTSNVNYTLTFALATNNSGVAPIQLVATESSSGLSTTNTFNLTVTLVNHAPSFALATNFVPVAEETAAVTVSNFVASFSKGPANQSSETFTYTLTPATNSATNAFFTTLTAATNGNLTILPKPHSYGTNTVTMVMTISGGTNNGGVNTFTTNFQVGVAQTNHAPTIVGATNRTLLENAATGLTAAINVWDYDKTTNFAFTATSLSNSVAAVTWATNAAGTSNVNYTLTFALATNASGVVPIQLVATETNSGLSTTNTFNLTVTLVNHAPSFALATNFVPVAEETAAVTVSNFVSSFSKGPANQSSETFTYTLTTVTTNSTNASFTTLTAATNGNLTILPKPHSYGTNTVTMVMTISGGTNGGGVNTFTTNFQVGVVQTNHAPVIVGATNRSILEDTNAGLTATINVWDYDKLSSNFTLTAISSNNSVAGVSVTGTNVASLTNVVYTLTFAPVSNANGVAGIQLVATETNSGLSTTNSFNLTVTAAHAAPNFTLSTNFVLTPEETASVTQTNFVAGWRSSRVWTFSTTNLTSGAATNVTFATPPAVDTNGTLTFAPTPHTYGTNWLSVIMSNGTNAFTNSFQIAVQQVSHAPGFLGDTNLVVLENGTNGLVTTNIVVWDFDLTTNFTLTATSLSNTLATVSVSHTNVLGTSNVAYSLTFAPVPNANGNVPIQLVATENTSSLSTTNIFTLTITPVNQAPSYTLSATNVAVPEESAAVTNIGFLTNLLAGPPNESSQTWSFTVTTVTNNATNVSFTVLPAVDTNGNLTFTPAPHSFGTNFVSAIMTDTGGTANGGVNTYSNSFTIQVAQINHAPGFLGDTNLIVFENNTNGLVTTNVIVWDYDQVTNFTLTATSLSNSLATASLSGTNVLGTSNVAFSVTFAPANNANGTVPIQLVATEPVSGLSTTNIFTLTITPVTQPPSFTFTGSSITDGVLTVPENTGPYTNSDFVTGSAGPVNQSSDTLSYTVACTSTNESTNVSFTVPPAVDTNGNLTFTTATNSFGTNTVTVIVTSSGSTANGGVNTYSNTFVLDVTQVQYPPAIQGITNETINENSATNLALTFTVYDPLTANITVTAVLSDTNLGTVSVSSNGAQRTLTFAPTANTFGTNTVTVTADDGTLTNATNISWNIAYVNQAPSFSLSANSVTVNLYDVAVSTTSFLTNISAGPANESGQTVSFTVTNSSPGSFLVAPSISSSGTLAYTPAATGGTVTVGVTAVDTGGTANGGVNTSGTQTFTIVIPPNPFPYLNGPFAGLFYDTNSLANASSGYFSLNLTTNGSFSGYVLCAGDSNTFTGQFNMSNTLANPNATATAGNYNLALSVDTSANWTETVSGSVSNSTTNWNASLVSYLAGYSASFPTPLAGGYTLALPGFADPTAGPAGEGIFSLTISTNGTASVSGYTADNTYASQASQLSLSGYYPLYIPLYSNGVSGSLLGWLNVTGDLTNAVSGTSTVTWFNEPGATTLYPAGFTNQSVPLAAYYDPTVSPLLSFTNGTVILSGGNLAAPITTTVTISGNVITVNPSATNSLTLTITPSTGEIQGSFIDPSSLNTNAIESIILQNTTNSAAGYFLGTNEGGKFILLGN
jgi:hypothetical protein